MTPYRLYRAYDAADRLLYVGVTGDLAQRQRLHSVQSAWFADAVRWTSERYPSQEAALAAERRAILAESPLHNVPGSERARRGAAARLPGHTLRADGSAFDANRTRIGRGTAGGRGRALCSCGQLSPVLGTAAERKQWHRDHKADVREQAA